MSVSSALSVCLEGCQGCSPVLQTEAATTHSPSQEGLVAGADRPFAGPNWAELSAWLLFPCSTRAPIHLPSQEAFGQPRS